MSRSFSKNLVFLQINKKLLKKCVLKYEKHNIISKYTWTIRHDLLGSKKLKNAKVIYTKIPNKIFDNNARAWRRHQSWKSKLQRSDNMFVTFRSSKYDSNKKIELNSTSYFYLRKQLLDRISSYKTDAIKVASNWSVIFFVQ